MKHEKSTLRIGSHLAMAVVVTFLGATLAAGQTQTVLYRFEGGTDSGDPAAGLVSDKAGNLYGTTEAFQIGCGTVFELVRPTSPGSQWIEEVIYAFYCENDGTPEDALIIDQAGNLYGTTYHNGLGSVFELSPPATQGGAWTETVLHSFTQRSGDGGGSVASLAMDNAGNLYGTTEKGGSEHDCGIVFELSPPVVQGGQWTEAILLRFNGGIGGAVPAAGLARDQAGNLYGTTFYGGTAGFGVIFKLAPPANQGGAWKETNLYNFTGTDGGYPAANLLLRGGDLYGTAVGSIEGNSCEPSCGVIFELSPPSTPGAPWTHMTLYAFAGGSDGVSPYAPVVFDQAGNLYTTTSFGGHSENGTVVELSPPSEPGTPWMETILWRFEGGTDGANPSSSLIFDPEGNLYGTTDNGGSENCDFGCGTVFRIKP